MCSWIKRAWDHLFNRQHEETLDEGPSPHSLYAANVRIYNPDGSLLRDFGVDVLYTDVIDSLSIDSHDCYLSSITPFRGPAEGSLIGGYEDSCSSRKHYNLGSRTVHECV